MMKNYRNKHLQPMSPWEDGVDMSKVSVSVADQVNGSPKTGDMIAINPSNPNDQWLVAKEFFEVNYEEA